MSLTRTAARLISTNVPNSSNVGQTLDTKLSEIVSVNDYGAVGNDDTPNDDIFATIESSSNDAFYLPEGTYNLPNTLRLTKTYWGPGQIKFKDGYIQKGRLFTDYPARNEDGHRVLTSPADIVMRPNGNVTFENKSIQNIGDPHGEGDAVNLRHINTNILPRIEAIETALNSTDEGGGTSMIDYQTGSFTPIINGGNVSGEGIYTRQIASWVKVGRLVTLRCSIAWTDHSGSGRFKISTNAPTSVSGSNIGAVLVTGNPYATDTPTASLFSGINGNELTIFRKDGNGQYTTYLNMKPPVTGVAKNPDTSTNIIVLEPTASDSDKYYVDRTIKITDGTSAGAIGRITAYSGSTKTATIQSYGDPITIDNTSNYTITNSGGIECVVSYETTN